MKRSVAMVGAVVVLAACEALPNVGYKFVTAPEPRNKEITSYALQETVVSITADKDDKLAVTFGRTEHQRGRVLMFDKTSWGVDADIGIVKFDNTDIPSEIIVKVTDSRKELAEKAGAALVKVIGLKVSGQTAAASPSEPPFSPPINDLNLSQLLSPAKDPDRSKGVVITSEGISISFDAVPADAIASADLSKQEPGPFFYYAACRNATLRYEYKGKRYASTVKVSDPKYLQRVRLPYDGKVTMHSHCGASVTGKLKGANGTEIALIQALIEQADAVKKAVDKLDEANKQ
jgi:hypothetical protein